jgi:hypothetical protein
MELTITDEGTRRVALFALWTRLHDAFGDGTNAFYDEARASVEHAEDVERVFCEAEEEIDLIHGTLRDAKLLKDATCGDTVRLSLIPEVLAASARDCADYVRESEDFWRAESRQRDAMLDTFDAASTLTRSLVDAVAS